MSVTKTIVSKDNRLTIDVSDEVFEGCCKVTLSTLHPVLAQAGFDLKEEECRCLFFGNIRSQHGDKYIHGNDTINAILDLIDDHVHDFYFGFYPKVMSIPTLTDGDYIHPTRYGMPKCTQRYKPFGRSQMQVVKSYT